MSRPCRHPLATLLLCLSLTACGLQPPSTPASIARTERARLPTIEAELTRTEKLPNVSGHETGELVAVDKGFLDALVDLAGQATVAVERLNNRVRGWITERGCTASWLETGEAGPGCPAR